MHPHLRATLASNTVTAAHACLRAAVSAGHPRSTNGRNHTTSSASPAIRLEQDTCGPMALLLATWLPSAAVNLHQDMATWST
jgi:hypothetical protein